MITKKSAEHERLLQAAKEAVSSSYSPYSGFPVGAAVLGKGQVFVGANIENGCSNLGLCAERAAIVNARMAGIKELDGLAVYCKLARTEAESMPCGACLQWMSELAPRIWIVTNQSDSVMTLDVLLPKPFKLGMDKHVK